MEGQPFTNCDEGVYHADGTWRDRCSLGAGSTSTDSVGVVDDEGEAAPAEGPLGLPASPGSQQHQIGTHTSGFGELWPEE